MSPLAIFFLSVSMSADAFAASIGKGASSRNMGALQILKTGAVFGVIEAITPAIGWAIGFAAKSFVQSVDHWIAFVLLAGVGGRMIYNSLTAKGNEATPDRSFSTLLATAIGTSLDAMVVGISLAFVAVNIVVVATAIGFATFVASCIGLYIGRFFGERLGRAAEVVAGIALIAIGSNILFQHLTAPPD